MTTTEAELLAAASSHRPEHDHHGSGACRACRWFEVTIHRLPEGSYRVVTAGRTTREGEVDRLRTELMASPHAVIDLLAMSDSGRTYLPWTSRKALHEAAEVDQRLGDALDDFDLLHGSAG